ncbi:neuroglian-like [Corticium candelabrum]|uniref:neuroglian-like n=1 Tax=Corticium candelabrum TaxID=121492 RepID=UPI002E2752FD|nr:neuroglian-like [Corticium candelabrum]
MFQYQLLPQSNECWLVIILVSLGLIGISTSTTNSYNSTITDQLSVQCRRPRSQPATSNEVAFFANESVLFWCRTPWESMSEKVTWSINERPIDESDCPPHADSHCAILEFGKHLRINDLMPNDAGNIKCHTNGRSSPFLAITVTDPTVQSGPAILAPWNQTAVVGSNVSIVFITKYADVFIFWRDDPHHVIQTSVGNTYENRMDGNLHVMNVSKADEGKYTVKALNSHTGQTRQASKYLRVYEKSKSAQSNHNPEPSETIKLTGVTTTTTNRDSQESSIDITESIIFSSDSSVPFDLQQAGGQQRDNRIVTIVIFSLPSGILMIIVTMIIATVYCHRRVNVVEKTVIDTNHIVIDTNHIVRNGKNNSQSQVNEAVDMMDDISRIIDPAAPLPSASASSIGNNQEE